MTSHLFRHLADQFEGTGFDVDHEYNRRYDLTKSLTFRRGDELGERRIFPDLIVHRRNRDDFNLVAIEAKKGERTDSDDCKKVQALLSQREYKYQCGVLLALGMTPPAGNGEARAVEPYQAWAPAWEWPKFDAASAGVATLIRVFGEAELGQLNDQGWQRFSSRLYR